MRFRGNSPITYRDRDTGERDAKSRNRRNHPKRRKAPREAGKSQNKEKGPRARRNADRDEKSHSRFSLQGPISVVMFRRNKRRDDSRGESNSRFMGLIANRIVALQRRLGRKDRKRRIEEGGKAEKGRGRKRRNKEDQLERRNEARDDKSVVRLSLSGPVSIHIFQRDQRRDGKDGKRRTEKRRKAEKEQDGRMRRSAEDESGRKAEKEQGGRKRRSAEDESGRKAEKEQDGRKRRSAEDESGRRAEKEQDDRKRRSAEGGSGRKPKSAEKEKSSDRPTAKESPSVSTLSRALKRGQKMAEVANKTPEIVTGALETVTGALETVTETHETVTGALETVTETATGALETVTETATGALETVLTETHETMTETPVRAMKRTSPSPARMIPTNSPYVVMNKGKNLKRAPTPAPVPVLIDWKLIPSGGVKGRVFGSETVADGEMIVTSPIASGAIKNNRGLITTRSGKDYYLSNDPESVKRTFNYFPKGKVKKPKAVHNGGGTR